MKFVIVFALFLFVSAGAVSAQQKTTTAEPAKSATQQIPKKTNARPSNNTKATPGDPFDKASVEMMAAQCVKVETDAGVIEFEMFPESAPESVRNFLNLVATKSLDTTTFNRVVPGFIIQGGNLGTHEKYSQELAKRAARNVPDEPNQIKHERGILSMARADTPNSATTNFFVLLGPAPHLDGMFAAFGHVVRGMETVEAINKMPVESEKPKNPVRIKRAMATPCTTADKVTSTAAKE